jgi:hypothetical protein
MDNTSREHKSKSLEFVQVNRKLVDGDSTKTSLLKAARCVKKM